MDAEHPTLPISVIVPAYVRVGPLLKTLHRIEACNPGPDEILVHVDGASKEVAEAVRDAFPSVKILSSPQLLGPGGSRNKLIEAARHELVANFDDDSFPEEAGYFSRVIESARRFPDAAVLSAASHEAEWLVSEYQRIAIFSGCGCVFRKSWFLKTQGFVPLPTAYGMEEIDVSLQLYALGGVIVHDPNLRVTHNHPVLEMRDLQKLEAFILANTALLPFLRYPPWLWPLGLWQLVSRLLSQLKNGMVRGLVEGLRMTPSYLTSHKSFRQPVRGTAVIEWMMLRRSPRLLGEASEMMKEQEHKVPDIDAP